MRQTLFWIPYEVGGVPIFGVGVLLAIWLVLVAIAAVWQVRKYGGASVWGILPAAFLVGAIIVFIPKAFPGAMPIRGYGVMLLAAVLAGTSLAIYRARQMGADPEQILSVGFWMFVAGIFGARLFHVIEYWERDYQKGTWLETLKAVVNIPAGGLVVYGSLIGGLLAFVVYMRKHKLPALAYADLIAPSLVLGLALGRIGCLLNGCCYGGPCHHPWAVTFPAESGPYDDQLVSGQLWGITFDRAQKRPVVKDIDGQSVLAHAGVEAGDRLVTINDFPARTVKSAKSLLEKFVREGEGLKIKLASGKEIRVSASEVPQRSLPVHPTQIYSAITASLLCLLLLAFYPFRRRDGEVIALLLTLYPISRFLIEIIRTDEAPVFQTGMSISQNVSLLVLVAVVGFWMYLLSRPRSLAFAQS